jgi:hypothetical protein
MDLPWISAFLLLFASGALMAGATMPVRVVGERFLRVNVMAAMVLAVLGGVSTALFPQTDTSAGSRHLAMAFGAAILLYAVAVRLPRIPPRRPLHLALAAWGAASVYASAPERSWAVLVACPTAAAALGMALVAMMLGRSYLKARNPSFELLAGSCRILIAALLLRGIASAVFFIPASDPLSTWASEDPLLVLLVGVRYGVGTVCAIALAWMALACAKIRSNQSATGILYVVLGFVVMGELIAAYMTGAKGLAL